MFSAHSVIVLATLVINLVTAASKRETINFDFAWRHFLGSPTGNYSRVCTAGTKGINYGLGGRRYEKINTPEACCAKCAEQPWCGCWDLNIQTNECWIKSECATSAKNDERISALLPPAPPSPAHPPASKTTFNDSDWELVDLPHDMLVVQPYDENAEMKHAYLDRQVGWYRKHFFLPSDWASSSVWLYFEGAFHETTAWLNGQQLASPHVAGYTSFWLRLDNVEGVQFGEGKANVLAVYVNATTGTGWWYEGGGINRQVHLVRASPLHIQPHSAWVHSVPHFDSNPSSAPLNPSSSPRNPSSAPSNPSSAPPTPSTTSASFLVSATAVNDGKDEEKCVRVCVSVRGGVVAAGPWVSVKSESVATTNVSFQMADVELWDVTNPSLYTVTVALETGQSGHHIGQSGQCSGHPQSVGVIDAVNVTVGVRSVDFDPNLGLMVNKRPVKMRGFCDHSSFAGVGVAVPDRINLFRAQALRSVGGNAWRMAHNPPTTARLDFMDRLGMLCDDENRDYGGHIGQGGITDETVTQELIDMADMVKRDRNHPSVLMWSFCNEVGCRNESSAQSFREVAKALDPYRPVTQNRHGTDLSTRFLDVQGFSHKSQKDFVDFHHSNPAKPLVASECCSCMSQRGVDQDECPHPRDGGCDNGPELPKGVFYNNNIGECTASQVLRSDSLDYVSGTFVWSGFDYMGEARGWPQNTKCRGTVADVAGFRKETAYWLRSWWLSNISASDPGRPSNVSKLFKNSVNPMQGDLDKWTVYIVDTWAPPPTPGSNRTIHIYTNAPSVRLLINGILLDEEVVPYFGMATFSVVYEVGNITAVAIDQHGDSVASYTAFSAGEVTSIQLTLDAPSFNTGTGSRVVLDGEDVAMVRATLLDGNGHLVPTNLNITFEVVSGPGRIWATHNGDPANLSPGHTHWNLAYKGLARAIIRTTVDSATSPDHRRRLLSIDAETTVHVCDPEVGIEEPEPIVLKASVQGLAGVTTSISIPTSVDRQDLPLNVAASYARQG